MYSGQVKSDQAHARTYGQGLILVKLKEFLASSGVYFDFCLRGLHTR